MTYFYIYRYLTSSGRFLKPFLRRSTALLAVKFLTAILITQIKMMDCKLSVSKIICIASSLCATIIIVAHKDECYIISG